MLKIRKANIEDTDTIFQFICELAEFEKLRHEVIATQDGLKKSLFESATPPHVFIAERGGKAMGFALAFFNYSTFLGQKGLYLEDLYVPTQHRAQGIGSALLKHLAQFAIEQECGRFEWSVLDWNEKAIALYKKIGAKPMSDWTMYRLAGPALHSFAQASDY